MDGGALIIYFVNESSLSERDARRVAGACDYQARAHFQPAWNIGVSCAYAGPASTAVIPKGSAIMHLLDTADQPGALGYHDEDGNQVPFGRVFVQTTRQDGERVTAVASHETLELAVNPHISYTAPTGDLSRLYALEVGDPVQGNDYAVGVAGTNLAVADFVLPSYFDPNTPASQPTSYRGSVKGPFSVAPQGYYSYIDLSNVQAGWQQQLGQDRKSAPKDDRLDRLNGRFQA